jgi:biopolymer transport protein ExbB/TolQ
MKNLTELLRQFELIANRPGYNGEIVIERSGRRWSIKLFRLTGHERQSVQVTLGEGPTLTEALRVAVETEIEQVRLDLNRGQAFLKNVGSSDK